MFILNTTPLLSSITSNDGHIQHKILSKHGKMVAIISNDDPIIEDFEFFILFSWW